MGLLPFASALLAGLDPADLPDDGCPGFFATGLGGGVLLGLEGVAGLAAGFALSPFASPLGSLLAPNLRANGGAVRGISDGLVGAFGTGFSVFPDFDAGVSLVADAPLRLAGPFPAPGWFLGVAVRVAAFAAFARASAA